MTKSKTIALAVLFVLVSFANSASAHLHPGLGRFVQRDPLGYVDGPSFYTYLRANIHAFQDPHGTQCADVRVPPPCPQGFDPIVEELHVFPDDGMEVVLPTDGCLQCNSINCSGCWFACVKRPVIFDAFTIPLGGKWEDEYTPPPGTPYLRAIRCRCEKINWTI